MIDFVTFINQNTPNLTAQQKLAMLDDFVYQNGYQDEIDDGQGGTIPNPITKSEFMNEIVTSFIRDTVKAQRTIVARESITVEELDM